MTTRNLQSDALGTTRLVQAGDGLVIERDTRTAHALVRWLGRRLAAREAAALVALAGVEHVPRLLEFDGAVVRRTFLPGVPLHEAPPRSRAYFVRALRLLRLVHGAGIAHNDLAKEANWLVAPGEHCAIVDFQLATLGTPRRGTTLGSPRRGTRSAARTAGFRRRAYEDLRHLLKHKRTYQPQALTARQRRLLARPTAPTRVWRALVKPLYLFTTRTLLGWPDRAGPAERRS
ncbi:MAG TPA: serine/threonine protein kinase [Gammaproteobacteria bacterium]|nr:serine/threonine protein kinase [Gammaproteobacteria bacterium]